jgi:hypothetical protein
MVAGAMQVVVRGCLAARSVNTVQGWDDDGNPFSRPMHIAHTEKYMDALRVGGFTVCAIGAVMNVPSAGRQARNDADIATR